MSHIDEVLSFADNIQPVAILECDSAAPEDMEIIRVNDAFFELLNSPTRVLYKYNPLDIVYERDRWKIVESIKEAIDKKTSAECESLKRSSKSSGRHCIIRQASRAVC